MDIKNDVRQYILENHLPGEAPETLPDDAPLLASGILDSIAVLGLIQFIETRYEIEFLPRELDLQRLDSLASIEETIVKKLQCP